MKNKLFKSLTSLLLVVVMIASLLPVIPVTVNAADTETVTYTFSSYTAGTQYAEGEEHELDDKLTITTTQCHFTTQLRIYSSTTNNGYAILECTDTTKAISGLSINAGYKKDTVNIYGSNDGSTWTTTDPFATVTTTTTSYKDYPVDFGGKTYKYLKLDVAGTQQIRVASITLTFATIGSGDDPDAPGADPDAPTCEHANTQEQTDGKAATCTETGLTNSVVCLGCGETVKKQEEISALGHNYVDGVCTRCDAKEPAVPTYEKVTATPTDWSGIYLIVYEDGGVAFNGSLTTLDAVGNTVPVTIENGKIVGNFAANTFTIAKMTDGYSIQSASGKYIGQTSNSNGLASSDSTIYDCALSLSDGSVNILSSGGAYLRYNADSNQVRFRFYKSSSYTNQKAIALYKLVEETTEPGTPACEHTNTTTLPAEGATCTTPGKTAGEKCSDCGYFITAQEEIPATGHNYVDLACTVCGNTIENYSGKYYIATKRTDGNYWYMTSTLTGDSTTRYTAVDTGLTTLPGAIYNATAGYVFVLDLQGDGTYLIYAEGVESNNYLGWTSENSGALVDKASAKAFTVEKTADGLFNIHFTGDADRYLSLNGTKGNNYFAFYAGTQKQDLALIPVLPAPAEITEAAVALSTDLSLRYRVELAEGENIADFKMVFTLNGETVEATSTNGKFTLRGIAPHMMGDTITATLYKGEDIVATHEYSIKEYLESIVNDATWGELAKDLLVYGAAAQKHKEYKLDALVTTETPNVDGKTAPDSVLSATQNMTAIGGLSFTEVGVSFDYVNKLYIKLDNETTENVTVKVNGNVVDVVNGCVYTDAIAPADFDETYKFELCVDDEVYQTVTYSVNSYISAKWETSDLAQALYNYAENFN